MLRKTKTVSKLKNTQLEKNSFRKTRSQSLFQQQVPEIKNIDLKNDPVPDENCNKIDNVEKIDAIETPKMVKRDETERMKRLTFTDVNVFYFERTPGHTSIPRDGFNTIGMEMRHSHQEKLKFNLQKVIFDLRNKIIEVIVKDKTFLSKFTKIDTLNAYIFRIFKIHVHSRL